MPLISISQLILIPSPVLVASLLYPPFFPPLSSPFLYFHHPVMPRWNRTVVLAASLVGALVNFILAIQVFALWSTLKWDSEWEGSLDPWTVNSLSLLGGISAAYFLTAAVASTIGFSGIVKVGTICLSNRM